jgi:heme o synthase
MKAAVVVCPEADAPLTRTRLADYLELTKPRVAVLVLVTVAGGVLLASGRSVDGLLLVNAVVGTGLVAGGASALNQLIERRRDGRMRRTENRPLPAGRLSPSEVLAVGLALGAGGVAYLALALPHPLAAALAALTFLLYVGVYTPLKPVTVWNTLVGAVPGALPPVIGWAAVRGTLDAEVLALFGVLFVWQVPHFYAIAWMYRDDYARAGYRMLSTEDAGGRRTARHMVAFCVALLAVGLVPWWLGAAGAAYAAGSLALGVLFLGSALAFRRRPSVTRARRVLRCSLVYLPALLGLWLLDVGFRSLLAGGP